MDITFLLYVVPIVSAIVGYFVSTRTLDLFKQSDSLLELGSVQRLFQGIQTEESLKVLSNDDVRQIASRLDRYAWEILIYSAVFLIGGIINCFFLYNLPEINNALFIAYAISNAWILANANLASKISNFADACMSRITSKIMHRKAAEFAGKSVSEVNADDIIKYLDHENAKLEEEFQEMLDQVIGEPQDSTETDDETRGK